MHILPSEISFSSSVQPGHYAVVVKPLSYFNDIPQLLLPRKLQLLPIIFHPQVWISAEMAATWPWLSAETARTMSVFLCVMTGIY